MKIEVLYVPNCPNHIVVLGRLRDILTPASFQAHVREIPVKDAAMAQSLNFRGSPTIRVNGSDVEPENGEPENGASQIFGLTCRLYSDGSGAPSERSLRAAIERACSAGKSNG